MFSIQDRLRRIEDEFLSALYKGGEALTAFDKRWETLVADVEDAMESLDASTMELAYATASRLSVLTDTSVEILGIHDSVTSDLMNELDALMSELCLSDSSSLSPSPSPSSPNGYPPTSGGESQEDEIAYGSRKRRRETDPDLRRPKRFRNHWAPAPEMSGPRVATSTPHLSLPLSPGPTLGSDVNVPSSIGSTSSVPPPRSRKRRLSDADVCDIPHPSKRLYQGPRLHAVSDSYIQPISRKSDQDSPLLAKLSESPSPTLDVVPSSVDAIRPCQPPAEFGREDFDLAALSSSISFDLPRASYTSMQENDLDSLLAFLSQPDPFSLLHSPLSDADYDGDGRTSPAFWYSPTSQHSPSGSSSSLSSPSAFSANSFPITPPTVHVELDSPPLESGKTPVHVDSASAATHPSSPTGELSNSADLKPIQPFPCEVDVSPLTFDHIFSLLGPDAVWNPSLDVLDWSGGDRISL